MRIPEFPRYNYILLFAIVGATLALPLFGEDKPAEKEPDIGPLTPAELNDQRIAFAKTALGRFTIQVGDRKEQATVSDPCLRWSNPQTGVKDGILAVFAFNGGRPVVVSQFFRVGTNRWCNEFSIIPASDVTIMHSGRTFWKATEYVCKFADVPDSPVPADKPALRLPQMRKIAADFSAVDYQGWEDADIAKLSLRLLPQPVYRYSEEGTILDGGLFVYAVGTDPECGLLLEAYQDDKGARYRYAFTPISIYQLEARYQDAPVWDIERRKIFGPRCRKYFSNYYRPVPGETVPD